MAGDFAAPTDDSSPIPTSFAISADIPALDPQAAGNDQVQDDIATDKEAAPYWHPAWESVETKFNEKLEAYDGNNIVQFKDLPADEFKIRVLANQVVREELKSIMEDVKRAVESVEQRPKPAKQPKSGK